MIKEKMGLRFMKPMFKDEYIKAGIRIATIRRARGMSQQDVADCIEVEAYYVSKSERAAVGMTLDMLFAIAAPLGVPAYELLDFRELERFTQ